MPQQHRKLLKTGCEARAGITIVAFSLILLLSGCDSYEPPMTTALVYGKVVDHGQPVAHAQVCFVASAGPMSTGWTEEDGTFELLLPSDQKGAAIGENKVIVMTGQPVFVPATTAPVPTDREAPPPAAQGSSFHYSFAQPILVKSGQNKVILDLSQADKHKK